ncbi:helix-turn-helix domain-containing protein [Vreelandella venusta]|uniref:Transposase IS30-like HTH domain-containing protein n=1 Tax=Vreelandella venusta TaxID=44935 RepID=A0ABX2BBW7_9GAMM|nr:helix-turn-helix domain-containing protein [Halomonas venusta]AZM96567.1 helix-turn-helix domain-containing protein [Halomonas venusta]NPT30120.1 hypothetical protein [Halomonas venusta]
MGYRQLTQVQRYQIFAYLETDIRQRQIAKAIGVHSSTISREIKRNGLTSGYAGAIGKRSTPAHRMESDEAATEPGSLGHWSIDGRMESSANQWLHDQCQRSLREPSVDLRANLGLQETRRNIMKTAPAATPAALSAPVS